MSYHLLNTDGGMVNDGKRNHGDPCGEAAVAVVLSQVKNDKERVIEAFSGAIGLATNAEAEYQALIEGLHFAFHQEHATDIRVFVDAEYVADHLTGHSKVGDNLRGLHADAKGLLEKFNSHRISWVPRERNQTADLLVRAILYPGE